MNDILLFALVSIFVIAPVSIITFRLLYKNSHSFYISVALVLVSCTVAILSYSTAHLSLLNLLWGVPVFIVVAFLVSKYLHKRIDAPLGKIANDMSSLASGDLTIKPDESLKDSRVDELKLIAESFLKLYHLLNDTVNDVISSGSDLNKTSKQLNDLSQKISQGAFTQAASAEEASSSMEEMSANIQLNTEMSVKANELTESMQKNVAKIHRAAANSNKSLEDIVAKINIINEIAQKTDLLAINAAIEAASAGVHGKGFAVVAGEVRQLAVESLNAAKEINVISSDSLAKAANSNSLIENLLPSMDKISTAIKQIAEAGMEQNSGANQVNSAVQSLNSITQQNAGTASQMTDTAEEIANIADLLIKKVDYYKTLSNEVTNIKLETVVNKPKAVEKQIKVQTAEKVKPSIPKQAVVKKNTPKASVKKQKAEEQNATKQNIPPKPKPKVESKGFEIELGDYDSDDGFEKF